MTRTECEAAILRKMIEINEIQKEYNPTCNYLHMSILDGHYSVNNDSHHEDKEHPLNAWYRPDEDEYATSCREEEMSKDFNLNTGEVVENAT